MGKQVEEQKVHFSQKTDYSHTLERMCEEFDIKFSSNVPSPINGLDDYDIKATLGAGSFGKVQLVKDRKSGAYYASKELNKDQVIKSKQVVHVMNEKTVLRSMLFPNVVHLVASYKDFDNLYLVLPLIGGGELFNYHRKVRKFSETQARFYAAQIFLALEYMHACKLLYRDLKPENIMLDKNGYIKVTDFGFAKKVETRTMTLCGTPEYLPPEIIQSKPYGSSVDWWAFGVLVYELVAGNTPFSPFNRDVMIMYSKICEAAYKIPTTFSSQLRHLIDHLLQVDLSKRLGNSNEGSSDVKNHAWFQSVEWYAILNQEVPAPFVPSVTGDEDLSNFESYNVRQRLNSPIDRHPDLFQNF
ncbi:hypothetical protein KR200_009497 [Drosophila serrata]|nr:hypothetical protein KR200_009497 [Drosophila serrata]